MESQEIGGGNRVPLILAIVLFVISGVLWVISGAILVSALRTGLDSACIGQGCSVEGVADAAAGLERLAFVAPFAVVTLIVAIMLLRYRRHRHGRSGPTSWDQIPAAASPLPPTPARWTSPSTPPATPPVGMGPAIVDPSASGASAERIARLRASGIEGTARLTGVRDTGMTVGGNRLYELDLDVQVPGRAPFRLRHSSFVPVTYAGRLVTGGTVKVRVDPVDREELVVDFEQPAPPGMRPPTLPGPQLA